jgi:hypothetical protein
VETGLSYATNRTNLQLRLGLESAREAQEGTDAGSETSESDIKKMIERSV